jgi:hypothetical protein
MLTAIAGLAALIADGVGLIGLAAVAGAGLAVGAALLCRPSARKQILGHAWRVITPHRILVGCANAWGQTGRGRLPIILYTAGTDVGERVYVWCRAGLTAADLLAARHVLAGACWATEVRVIPSVRHAHLVILEVIRNPDEERTGPTPNGWLIPRQRETGVLDDPEEPARSGLRREPTVRSV